MRPAHPFDPCGGHRIVALIPARAGSKRVLGKNTRLLNGKPLIQYTIDLAQACSLISAVVVSSDDPWTIAFADDLGCETPLRDPAHATDDAPDFLWVNDVMRGRTEDIFCILRPTSPFRTESTIRRAYARLLGSGADSVRAIERARQHPGKMWVFEPGSPFIVPYDAQQHPDGTPWHSSPTQTLPEVWVQNASLEMAWTTVLQQGTITGHRIAPFLTEAEEGFDINTPEDWARAEAIDRRTDSP